MARIKSKRVVLVAPTFPKLSETFVTANFTGFLESGWDVHVVCKKSDQSDWNAFPMLRRSELVRRVHVAWPHSPRLLEVLLLPLVLLRCLILNPAAVFRYFVHGTKRFGFIQALNYLYLDSEFIRLKPDLIHFEFGDLARGRLHLKEFLGARIVVSFRGHDLNFMGLEEPDFYNEIWERADGFHFMSQDLYSRAKARGFRNGKYSIIHGSVDCNYFDPGSRDVPVSAGTPERPLRIISIGRLAWSKGYEYALQAIQILMESGISCEYRIAGDGPYREAVNFTIRERNLEKAATLLSWRPPSEVKEEMKWADVFLHSSVSEGFGVVALEAQAMALPVVCTDADGLAENVSDGETGFVVPRRNAQALAEKLILLCHDPSLRKKMGAAGRERALRNFSVGREIAAYDSLLRKTLNLSESPAQRRSEKVQTQSDISYTR